MREQHAEQMIGTPLLQQVRHRPVETQRDARRVGRARSVGEREWHERDRKSTRLNSSHLVISYAVFCLKKKKKAQGTVPGSTSIPRPPALPATRDPESARIHHSRLSPRLHSLLGASSSPDYLRSASDTCS